MSADVKEIVVAMDNSRYSLSAAAWGAHLTLAFGGNLTLVHVLEVRHLNTAFFADLSSALGVSPVDHSYENYENAIEERGKNILMAGEQVARSLNVTPKTVLTRGVLHEEIKTITKEADLLILGRRGDHSGYGSHLFGAEGERAARHVDCSCLVVPENYAAMTRIVVGIHDSGPSRSAQRWTERIHASFPEAEVNPVHVIELADKNYHDRGMVERVGDQPVEVVTGNAEYVLVEKCRESAETTLCIIGATGHTRTLKEIILGTTSFHVLHKLTGPVLLAR